MQRSLATGPSPSLSETGEGQADQTKEGSEVREGLRPHPAPIDGIQSTTGKKHLPKEDFSTLLMKKKGWQQTQLGE